MGIEQSTEVTPTWKRSVAIRIGSGPLENVGGPSEALEALESRWPAGRGVRYDSAVKIRQMASGRLVDVEVARAAFVGAAKEADLLA